LNVKNGKMSKTDLTVKVVFNKTICYNFMEETEIYRGYSAFGT